MRFFSVLAAAVSLSLGGLVFAAPTTLKSVERYQGEVSGKYIVKFKEGVARKNWINTFKSDLAADDLDIINAIAGKSASPSFSSPSDL
jgi:cerevisin